jgi:quinol monooxygenase YgiN
MSPTTKKKAAGAKAKVTKSPAKPASRANKPTRTAAKPAAQTQINVIVWLHAKKGKEVPLERQLKALVSASRNEPGCLVFALHRSAAYPGDFFLHEIWSSEAALGGHRQTPHFKRWAGVQGAILESRRRFLAE